MKNCLKFLCGTLLIAGLGQAAEKKPNLVVILTDDQGYADVGFNGCTDIPTPNIDSLAHDGATFDRFYVCPVCSPTRAEFLTGRYHVRCGVHSTSAGGERLNLDERTIAETFKAAGYATGAFVSSIVLRPAMGTAAGFDRYDAAFPDRFLLVEQGQRTAEKTTAAAVDWLRQAARGEEVP